MMNNEKKTYVHVALVLDASGSMDHLRDDTIGSLKSFFAGFRSEEEKTVLDVWQFNTEVDHLVKDADLRCGAPETLENYTTEGGTALYDAVCIAIDELGRKFAAMQEQERPDCVVFAILTDGEENSSREFTRKDVKERIARQSGQYSWQFKFLAANQDAVLAGAEIGISRRHCASFRACSEDVERMCGPAGDLAMMMCEARIKAKKSRARAKHG